MAAELGGTSGQGFDFSISPDELRHIRERHGDEAQGDQRAVTPEDFARLSSIVDGADLKPLGTSRSRGHRVFETTATIDGEQYVARWEYLAKRRTMALITFFIKARKGA